MKGSVIPMSAIVEPNSPTEAIIVMRRTFDAPRILVWQAITDQTHVAKWWGGEGFTNPVCEMDVRVGGLWHHVMQAPNGARFTFEFVFVEVTPPEKLVWQNADHGKSAPGGPPTCVNTVTLAENGQRTDWKLVARFNSLAERDLAVTMGFGDMVAVSTDRLAPYLQSM
jgi:uncharacterized protein YndB with AHSA1/START domain